jgi:hypothetical protein
LKAGFLSRGKSPWLPWIGGSVVTVVTALVLLRAGGCSWPGPALTTQLGPASKPSLPPVHFTNVTAEAGIDFVHFNGAFGQKLLPETMGSGVAVLDFDNDGRPDLLFVNSRPWPGQPAPAGRPTPRLYRNRGATGFEDVTAHSGLDLMIYGMGVTVADYDNDGWQDVFITAVGGNHLFHNETGQHKQTGTRGPTFKEVTASAGVGGPGGWPVGNVADFLRWETPVTFSSSAAFLDYDGDGLLDLFVSNYVTWSPAEDRRKGFHFKDGQPAYGPPRAFDGAQPILYRNQGGGRFEDVSKQAGVQVFETEENAHLRKRAVGKSLAVIACDLEGDGWPDLVVANDTVRNVLFHNVPGPGGTRIFEEIGIAAGVAYAEGEVRGAMGVDWAPAYRAGKGALVIGNFAGEPDSFLRLEHPRRLHFQDVARAEGLANPSRSLLKFGTFFFDYDLDGRPDLLSCNGHLDPDIGRAQPGEPYKQPAQLYWNTGTDRPGFEVVTAEAAGPDLFEPLVGRGCAFLDYDGDGDLDVVLTSNGGPARLLRNEGDTGRHWIRLRLEGDGEHSNRSAIGARVILESEGQVQQREVASARGYLSQSELVLTFGLGTCGHVDRITIHWPGRHGGTQVVGGQDLRVDWENRIVQDVRKK